MVRMLRDAFNALKDKEFSPKEFHDYFMTYDLIPIKAIRQAM
jgi:hypothetical protein